MSDENLPEPAHANQSSNHIEKPPALSTADSISMSLDQSVRTFRLFETLRSGDTTAISKAIKETKEPQGTSCLSGTTILHLAIQCAEPQVVEYILSTGHDLDINARDRDGNTPLHVAVQLGRGPVVRDILNFPSLNDSIVNYHGQAAIDVARTPEIFQQLQLARSLFIDSKTQEIQSLVAQGDYEKLEKVLEEPRVEGIMDINSLDLATDPATVHSGGTLLHEGARKKDTKLIQILLMHGADPFRRDKKGKLPQDVTKDDRTRAILKKSPAAVIAQRGIQEKAILGTNSGQGVSSRPNIGESPFAWKDSREMKGYLKKWTNYTGGYKLRWFVLEDGVLSYYKHQDDADSACRGAINMKIAKLNMDSQDKTRFEIHGKSSVRYHLKANHVVEAKRWFWTLNNAIQWAKDEAKQEEKRQSRHAEVLRQAKIEQIEGRTADISPESPSLTDSKSNGKGLAPPSLGATNSSATRLSTHASRTTLESTFADEEVSLYGSYDPGPSQDEAQRTIGHITTVPDGDGDEDDYGDYASSREVPSAGKDALEITAQSTNIQLDILVNVISSLQSEKQRDPSLPLSDPTVDQALGAYGAAVGSIQSLVQNLLKISKDRDAYWQHRLNREAHLRQMWEESMARVAQEHEDLQSKMGESEEKRRRTKRALREALENSSTTNSQAVSKAPSRMAAPSEGDASEGQNYAQAQGIKSITQDSESKTRKPLRRQKSSLSQINNLYDSASDDEDEFFDAIDSGEIEVEDLAHADATENRGLSVEDGTELRAEKRSEIAPSFKGYEDHIRTRLKMDYDNRPKISLWGILKSMIGKDMTKMTLPVSFNEPTSLLQRVAEDLEYADLLDMAADRSDPMERLVYVAAYAASEYASTIGRVAKPFNPLLGETFEYVRPDKGYRFFVEQVSHHPPIGAAWAESPKWDYYGESALKSKFYGKSFDINLLGTWFLKLRPASGGEELYTWRKVTSSVIGIITGNPTVDNYGLMEIKNWTTGEVCYLDFKPRGWKASSAYQVTGKVVDRNGSPKWSIGGRWNDKIYARHTPGYEAEVSGQDPESSKTFLVWQCHTRPSGIPFNLTPFVITLNALPEGLKQYLPPTDTRLRPDQRAMEEGEYDFAAAEKHRVEEKQRSKRRERETKGEDYRPKFFTRTKCSITGEEYWAHNGKYWASREAQDWSNHVISRRNSGLPIFQPSHVGRQSTFRRIHTMASEHTCGRCLQVLRQSAATYGPATRLQVSSNTKQLYRLSVSTVRNFGSRSANRFIPKSLQVPVKRASAPSLCTSKAARHNLVSQQATSATSTYSPESRALLKPDNLFHPFSRSPSPAIRQRAAFIKQAAFCPHPSHQQTRAPVSPHDPESRKSQQSPSPPAHSHFECPDCGVPIYCSEGHWIDDFEAHLEVCETIRQINEDDHDLHSGRFFPEFSYPGLQDDNFVINMTNWDTFLYTREFDAINHDRSMRQVTRMLTYPLTIGSVLHELSPYSVRKGGRLTPEGLKSVSALRYTLHPPKTGEGVDIQGLRLKAPPVRVFILGARAESSLPREVWLQLSYIFPRSLIHLIFIGPESMANRDAEFPLPERTHENPFGGIVEDRLGGQMKITTYVDYFHTMYKAQYFQPFDPYLDCFMLFHPGLGHPASSHEWEETLPQLLETKVPIISTGYTQWDMERDISWVHEKCAGEFDMLLEPGENIFRSLRWDLNDLDPHDVSCGNWGLWAFRGKRYEATFKE
ncbi:Oxysterol-binding protein-domain-containing protein [Aspergillus avenaceus]|uniref:Oxysterol-binding protein-domain-containing protein n=1 Tax=Aspergillus avenaceus TaxID=36643 RepID=A0A5N6TIV3_ASPAV|nr:Oxysterol-binding protein-domain-containing protein [Aspergillus avenaceus]